MHTFNQKLWIIFVMLCFANLPHMIAQPGGLNSWYHFNLQGDISDNWRFSANVQQRFYDVPVQNSRLSLINGSVERRINPNAYVGGGYMFLLLEPYNSLGEKFSRPEHRLFQQITFNNTVSPRYNIAHRFRLEERYMFNSDFFVFRARYLFNSFWKLDRAENSVWGLIFRHEIRMNLEREQPFDSYRISTLLAKRVSPTLSIEPGVIVQFNGYPAPTDYYLTVSVRKSLKRRIRTYKPD